MSGNQGVESKITRTLFLPQGNSHAPDCHRHRHSIAGEDLSAMDLSGSAQAAMMLGQFTAAEAHTLEKRGRAMATVVLGRMVGPDAASILLFTIAAATVLIWLRPDPLEIARQRCHQEQQTQEKVEATRPFREILGQPDVRIAILSMVIDQ